MSREPGTSQHRDCEGCIFAIKNICGNCDLELKIDGVIRTWPGAKPCCDCVNPCAQARKLMGIAEGHA